MTTVLCCCEFTVTGTELRGILYVANHAVTTERANNSDTTLFDSPNHIRLPQPGALEPVPLCTETHSKTWLSDAR